jgi:hypothetical protein
MRYWRDALLTAIALVLSLGLGAAAAQAQEQVQFRVEAPTGNVDGYGVFGVTLFTGGAIVGEFNLPIMASSGFSSFATTISASDVPDEVEVEFAVPSDGTATLYSVAGVDFAFDVQYFLPNPSPGGVIGPQPGGARDAFFELSLVTVVIPDDQISPTCEITETSPGVLEAVLQDEQSGLAEIDVRYERNLTVVVPPFAPGTTSPVTVIATVDDPERTSVLALKGIDEARNRTLCKKVMRRFSSTRSVIRTFTFGWRP